LAKLLWIIVQRNSSSRSLFS